MLRHDDRQRQGQLWLVDGQQRPEDELLWLVQLQKQLAQQLFLQRKGLQALIIPLCVCFLWINARAQKFGPNRERGFSDQYRAENTLGQYAFGYNEDHTSGGSFRRETGDRYGNKIGSYGLRISDGRIRIVNYIADHNGYRADVMTNEPGMSNQKSNGYVEVTKKGFGGIMIPGFRNSAEAPHITFSDGNEKQRNHFNHGGIKDQQDNLHQEKMKEETNFNREGINEQYSKLNYGDIDQQANYNHGNRDNFHKDNIDAKMGDFDYDNINDQHINSNEGDNEAYQANFNRGIFDNQQLAFGKDHDAFTESITDEAAVIPQVNGVPWEDSNQEFHSGLGEENFYAPNVVFDEAGAESNVVQGVKKDLDDHRNSSITEHGQNSTIESTEHPTESRVTESVVKVSLGLSGNVADKENS